MSAKIIRLQPRAQARDAEHAKYIGRIPYEDGPPAAPNGSPVGSKPPLERKHQTTGKRALLIFDAICDSALPTAQKAVLFALLRHTGWKKKAGRPPGTCFPSLAQGIAKVSGLSERQIRRVLPALVRSGWLVREKRSEGGARLSDLYRITAPR